jgi:hypothetical protein
MTDDSKSSSLQPAKVEWYYIGHDGVISGPISEEGLQQGARSGQIARDTLIWQQDFDNWQLATRVEVTAAVLGRDLDALETTPTPSQVEPPPHQQEPQEEPAATETQAVADTPKDEFPVYEVLHEAVTDEEAADPTIDFELAREIVDRASGRPPRPTERSIPPSSVTWHPPAAGAQLVGLLGTHRLIGITAVSLLIAAVALVLVPRSHSRTVHPSDLAKTTVADRQVKANAGQYVSGVEIRTTEPRQPEQPAGHASTSESPALGAHDESSVSATQTEPVVTVDGPLKASLFSYHLKRSLAVFDEQCWDALRVPGIKVEKNPSVRVEIAVDLTGRVYDVKSSTPPPGYRGAGRCIAGRIRGWKFPWAERGTRAVIVVRRVHD